MADWAMYLKQNENGMFCDMSPSPMDTVLLLLPIYPFER